MLIHQFKKVQTVEHIQSPWHLYLSPVTIIAISLSFQSARSVVFGHGTSVWRMAAGRARWTNDQWSGGGRERRRSNEAEGSGAEARGVAQPPTTPQIQKHEASISMRPRTSPYLRLWCHSAELDLLQSQKERRICMRALFDRCWGRWEAPGMERCLSTSSLFQLHREYTGHLEILAISAKFLLSSEKFEYI